MFWNILGYTTSRLAQEQVAHKTALKSGICPFCSKLLTTQAASIPYTMGLWLGLSHAPLVIWAVHPDHTITIHSLNGNTLFLLSEKLQAKGMKQGKGRGFSFALHIWFIYV